MYIIIINNVIIIYLTFDVKQLHHICGIEKNRVINMLMLFFWKNFSLIYNIKFLY